MNALTRTSLALLTLASISLPAAAQSPQETAAAERVLKAFTSCDASFFKAMHAEGTAMGSYASLARRGDAAAPSVKNRSSETDSLRMFYKPLVVNGLTLVGYHDEIWEWRTDGAFYFWGFYAEGNIETIARALKPVMHDAQRFVREADGGYVRSEIRKSGSKTWDKVATVTGESPAKGTIERVFVLEQDNQVRTRVKVFCSLQGSIDATTLAEIRPDLDPKDYVLGDAPPKPAANLAKPTDATSAAAAVAMAAANAAKAAAQAASDAAKAAAAVTPPPVK